MVEKKTSQVVATICANPQRCGAGWWVKRMKVKRRGSVMKSVVCQLRSLTLARQMKRAMRVLKPK